MTFARRVKEELIRLDLTQAEKLAELSALLHIQSEIEINSEGVFIVFKSKNIPITRHFFKLIKDLYGAEIELYTKESDFKKKEMIVKVSSHTQNIISEHSLLEENVSDYRLLLNSQQERRAYLRGAFLASGSINDPIKPNYHFEIYTTSKVEAVFVQSLLNEFNLNSKIAKRRKGLIIYLKDAEAISEFLKIVGAYESVFEYENLRIQRDFNNSINRLINIEIANERKTLKASKTQLLHIRFIKQYKDISTLDPKVLQVITLREENPESSLAELCEIYKEETGESISKSGMNHRFLKIKELAYNIAKSLHEAEQSK